MAGSKHHRRPGRWQKREGKRAPGPGYRGDSVSLGCGGQNRGERAGDGGWSRPGTATVETAVGKGDGRGSSGGVKRNRMWARMRLGNGRGQRRDVHRGGRTEETEPGGGASVNTGGWNSKSGELKLGCDDSGRANRRGFREIEKEVAATFFAGHGSNERGEIRRKQQQRRHLGGWRSYILCFDSIRVRRLRG
uniref:Uncharacterized protein n=1 Tax=Oryza brachyantha TaxID=4533 RepID=J3MS86_ORYBR